MKLSILIPTKNEEFLKETLADIEKHKEGDTEVLWEEDKGLGQRGLTNKLAQKATGDYLMKLDAHCSMAQGFDVELLKEVRNATVVAPALTNLYAYDWICSKGHRQPNEQFEEIKECPQCKGKVEKAVVWQPIPKPIMTNYYFDTDLHFQYCEEQDESPTTETMSLQGSCFVISKEDYFRLNICDEKFGSWGQQGTEVACKAWLSGGRVISTRNTFYSHWFRGRKPAKTEDIKKAQQYSKDLFLKNKWEGQVKPLAWLIEKFDYQGDWTPEQVKKLCTF